MGNENTKLNYRKAVIQLTTKTQPVDASDDSFWNQFWSEYETTVQDIFILIPAAEIRALREESPSNLATLCYKAVEMLVQIAEGYPTHKEQQTALNCIRLLSRLLPYIFEDPDWRTFFWSTVPAGHGDGGDMTENPPLAQTLISALCDLLFCPDFTVQSVKKTGPENPEDLATIDSCEYIWESGVGFAQSPSHSSSYDAHRTEILKLLLTCLSETMYLPPSDAHTTANQWIAFLTSTDNRHALPLFTSLLNTVCAYDPVGYGLPYNHLMFNDSREYLVEVALQVLCVTLESDANVMGGAACRASIDDVHSEAGPDNLFVNYMSRIHRDEDMSFILKGLTRLLNNPLIQTYLPGSTKKVHFHQELLILFWRMCDINKKFMFFVLKSSDVLDILVPVLYHLNDARADQSRVGLMHIGVFILLLLSGERNFGVRLNKPYHVRVPMDIPVFTGTHADLLIIVFHKIITTGHQRLQPLFDCLLTIIVNISPYLKTLSMVSSTKLLHLLEAFSTPWFLYASPTNHHLVFFLLEVFNNIIQYQFDGNSNLVYTIIRKRHVFHQLANLPTDHSSIVSALSKKGKRLPTVQPPTQQPSMEGAQPAAEAEPGTLKASLEATPAISNMTEKRSPGNGTGGNGSDGEGVAGMEEGDDNPEGEPDEEADDASPGAPREDEEEVTPTNEDPVAQAAGDRASPEPDSPVAAHPSDSPVHQGLDGVPSTSKVAINTASAINATSPISAMSGNAVRPTSTSSITSVPPTSFMSASTAGSGWVASSEWVQQWKHKLPLQTIMRLLQVLVPQVEKICIDKGLTDESEILKFLQHGTLVGLLPVPHPILIRKYQANAGTTMWFRTYMWGVIYLRNVDPPIWYDTDVRLFEIQRV